MGWLWIMQIIQTRVVAMIRLHKLEWLRYSVKWLMMMVRLRLLMSMRSKPIMSMQRMLNKAIRKKMMSIKHQRLMMRVLKQLLSSFSDNFQQMVASQKLQSDKHGVQSLQKITQEENEEAMRLALEQYSKLTAPWQKEAFIKKK